MKAFFFLIVSFSLSAQTDFFERYYPAIDRAEAAFVRDEFTEAIRHYTEAFQAVEHPLARDLYNGVVCYYLAGNIDGAKPWLLLLARKGIDAGILESQEAFRVENIQVEWESFKPVYRQISDRFVPEKEEGTDRLIMDIQEKMEEIRILHNEFPDIYYDMDSLTVLSPEDSATIHTVENKMKAIYDAISRSAAEHIIRHGLPSEERYGIVSEDLTMDALRSFLSNIRFYSLLEPGSGMISLLNERLVEEVGKGNVHRDYVLELLGGGNLAFVRLLIPIELPCHESDPPVFIHPKADHNFDLLLGENEEMQIEKGYYSVFRNKYFLMHERATLEDRVADDCTQLMGMNKELIRVKIPD